MSTNLNQEHYYLTVSKRKVSRILRLMHYIRKIWVNEKMLDDELDKDVLRLAKFVKGKIK